MNDWSIIQTSRMLLAHAEVGAAQLANQHRVSVALDVGVEPLFIEELDQAVEALRQRQGIQLGGVGVGHRLRHAGEQGADLACGHVLFDFSQQPLGQVVVAGRKLVEAIVGEGEDQPRPADAVPNLFRLDQSIRLEVRQMMPDRDGGDTGSFRQVVDRASPSAPQGPKDGVAGVAVAICGREV